MRIEDLPDGIAYEDIKVQFPRNCVMDEGVEIEEGFLIPSQNFFYITPDPPTYIDRKLYIADLSVIEPIDKLIVIEVYE